MTSVETNCVDVIKNSFEEEYLQKHLDDIAKNENISNPDYSINLSTKEGDNYIGIVYRVIINGEKNGKRVQIPIIMKCPPKDDLRRKALQITHFFPREAFFYQRVVPVFSQLLRDHGLILRSIPVCYGASGKEHEEVIILEDLREQGYVMRDRLKHFDYPHASLALRHLGRLHAYSFALRDQKPDVFQKLTDIKEPLFRQDLPRDGLMADRINVIADQVKVALAEEERHYTERFETFFENYRDEIDRCCNGKLAEPYTVINHGDFWTNNMLFRYNEGSSEPRDFYFLDFQVVRYASPVLDMLYLLFCCCNQELRSNHYDQLILDYHNSLSECLIALGSDPKRLFPFNALTDQLMTFGNFGTAMALFLVNMVTCGKDEINYFSTSDLEDLRGRIRRDEHYRNTLRDCVKDLIDRNYT